MRQFVALCLCLAFLGGTVAHAEKLVLATGEWVPYTSKNLEGYGEFTQMVSAVVREMGMEPEYRFYPWARCYDTVAKGRVWAAFPYSYNEERARSIWFSEPLAQSRTVFFYYNPQGETRHFTYNTLSDLKAYRVGGVQGYYYAPMFREAGIQPDYANTEEQAFDKLRRGRVDLCPMNDRVGRKLIARMYPLEKDRFDALPIPLSVDDLSLIVSPSYPDSERLLREFNAAIGRCRAKGLLQGQ